MRTPAGHECKFYYEDFNRGRNIQECRIERTPESRQWIPQECTKCPVPHILRANSSPHLHLTLDSKTRFLGFGHVIGVLAHCDKHEIPVEDPYIGCPQCNRERPGLELFAAALDNLDDD
jgi:hypothetical protein